MWRRIALPGLATLLLLAAAPLLGGAPAAEPTPAAPVDPCSAGPQELLWTPATAAPATPAEGLDGLLLARPPFYKTCRCSCGYPCQTNADCGPGGICGAGITCCAAPQPPGPPAVEMPGETVPAAAGVAS